jgi:glycosyltransferase involved in cell wall biosynthesis
VVFVVTSSHSPARTLAFVASCFNEQDNVVELYRRCLAVFEAFSRSHPRPGGWIFAMTLADNGSTDGTADVLLDLAQADPRVQVLINARNYGPEPSVVHALAQSQADLVVLLASDLEDPPELVLPMLDRLLAIDSRADAVLACKRSLPKGPLVQLGRTLYYRLLAFGTRSLRAPNGFHGFGVYRAEVVSDAVELWKQSAMTLRQALARSSHCSEHIAYDSSLRQRGRSSYGLMGYAQEALEAVFSGDAITTRLTMRLGLGALLLAIVLGAVIAGYVLRGQSGYAAGTPTVMLLVLASLGIQALLLSLLAYQIENLNLPVRRPIVRQRTGEGMARGDWIRHQG